MSRLQLPLATFLVALLGCSSAGQEGTGSNDGLSLMPQSGDSYDECTDWKTGDGYHDECKLDCPQGGPTGPIAVRFECHEVHVVSCKELSNVVLEFADGEHYKFDGLKGHYGTFGGGEREIVTVWVKAGNNASGDGPGYGERFDSDAECDGNGGTGGTGGSGGMDGGTGGMDGGTGGMGGMGGMICECHCKDDDDDCKDGYCDDDDRDDDCHDYDDKSGYHDDDWDDSDDYCRDYCDDYCDRYDDDECKDGDDYDGGHYCSCDPQLDCPHGGSVGYIEVEFECSEVHISSCKDISNVVLEFANGKHRKFDDLNGHCATIGVADKHIVGVWVKAGNNKSGDGPGYGERFDSDAEGCDGAGGTGGMGGDGGAGGMGGDGGAGGMGGMMDGGVDDGGMDDGGVY